MARATKRLLAAEAWSHLFDFFIATRWRRDEALKRFALTPNEAKALHTLDPDNGKSVGSLASVWGTDASTVTWLIGRLERKGYVARVRTPGDRRVKLVVLTEEGAAVRAELLRAFREPPPELLTLSRAELEALAKMLGGLRGGRWGGGGGPTSKDAESAAGR